MFKKLLDLLFPQSTREISLDEISLNSELISIRDVSTASNATVTTLSTHKNPQIRTLIHSAKYYKSPKAFKILAYMLNDYLQEELSDNPYKNNSTILIPIPLSKERYAERGFNQVEEILKELCNINADFSALCDFNTLKRTKNTQSQTRLKKYARLQNVRNAFLSSKSHSPDTHVILIDDVATTGATLFDAKRAIKESGIKNIKLLSIARA